MLSTQQPSHLVLEGRSRLLRGKEPLKPTQIRIDSDIRIGDIDKAFDGAADYSQLRIEGKVHSAPCPRSFFVRYLNWNRPEAFEQIVERAIDRARDLFLATIMGYSDAHLSPPLGTAIGTQCLMRFAPREREARTCLGTIAVSCILAGKETALGAEEPECPFR